MKKIILLATLIPLLGISCKKDCPRPDQCSLEPDPGPCEAIFTRYYYDKEAGKCKTFTWGGCDGTVPYETREACEECECV